MNKEQKLKQEEKLKKELTPYDAQLKRCIQDITDFDYHLRQAQARKEHLEKQIKEYQKNNK